MANTRPFQDSRRRDSRRRDRWLLSQRPLVAPIANHYAQLSPEPIEDLIQVGLIGLLRAAEGYDCTTQIPFECFARPHIRGAILHHLRDRAWLVRLPRRQAERQSRQAHANNDLASGALAASDQVLERWRAMSRPLSLENLQAEPTAPSSVGGGEETLERVLSAPEAQETYAPNGLAMAWQQCSVEQMLAMVGPRHRRVLRHVVLDGWSYRRTASAMNVSAPTVQRLYHRALAELQGRLSCDRAASAARGS